MGDTGIPCVVGTCSYAASNGKLVGGRGIFHQPKNCHEKNLGKVVRKVRLHAINATAKFSVTADHRVRLRFFDMAETQRYYVELTCGKFLDLKNYERIVC